LTAGFEEAVMKWSHVGLAAVVLCVLSGTAAAQRGVEYSVSRDADKATLTVTSGDFRFEETLSPTTFAFTLTRGGDVVRVTGDQRGLVKVVRGERAERVNMARASLDDLRRVRAMLSDSATLHELQAVSGVSSATKSPFASLLQSASAMIHAIQGDTRATGAMVVQVMARPPIAFRPAAQRGRADECWDGYTRAVLRYTYEYEGCVREARDLWWELWRLAWCAYEYDLKATLAGFWLLDCNGI
jgi:hypothetical protein